MTTEPNKTTARDLIKRAHHLGNDYSSKFCNKSISRQFRQKRLELIKLVDDEILKTCEQLNLLRAELIKGCKSKEPVPLSTVEKSIQVNFPCEIGIQVDIAPNDCSKDIKQKTSANKIHLVNNDTESMSPASDISKPKDISQHSNFEKSADKSLSSAESNTLISDNIVPTLTTSEQRYNEKLMKILQNRKDKNEQQPDLDSREKEVESAFTNDQFASFIADKIYNKIQNNKSVKENINKLNRSIAVETSFSDVEEPKEQMNASLREQNEEYNLLHDDTIYLNLPTKKLNKLKSGIVNQRTNHALSHPSQSSIAKHLRREAKDRMPCVEIDFVKNGDHLTDLSQMLNFTDISRNTSLFKTLPAISSNCSTPVTRQHSTLAESLQQSILSFSLSNNNLDIDNLTLNPSLITLNSPDYENSDFTLDKSKLSILDRNQFWKDVFHKAGIDYHQDLVNDLSD